MQHVDRPRGGFAPEDIRASVDDGDATPRRKRFLIVHNPIAGRNRLDIVQDVARCLERAGAVADLQVKEDNATDGGFCARIGTYDAVVASGGDGTVRSMVAMLGGRDVPFGLIPAGTGNVLAEELGLPRNAGDIADMLLHGPVVPLSTASINGAPCLLMVGAGFDGQVIAGLPMELKRQIGKPAFGWPILAALARKPSTFKLSVDGRPHEASWLVVSNAARYAGRFLLSENTNILSPGFNVVISRATSRGQRLLELLYLVAGRLASARTIQMMPARTVDIRDAESLAVQVDGEAIVSSTYSVVADVARTPMIVPRRLDQTVHTPTAS
jgi:diacylglycerol kinase family enzyme